jgi:hypothetical protein
MRQPADKWCQVNLRIKNSLRIELAAAAKRNQVSFNAEVRMRLVNSLEDKPRQSLADLARNIELAWRRLQNGKQDDGTVMVDG